MDGPFAELHYVKVRPDARDLCFELVREEPGGGSVGYIAVGGSVGWHGGVTRPFRAPDRVVEVAMVDRLVVLPEARGKGAKEVLLRALGDAYHSLGFPMRLRTASEKVAGSLSRCPLLCLEGRREGPRAASERGQRREGWVFWYVGSPVVHAHTGRRFRFKEGGLGRFVPA